MVVRESVNIFFCFIKKENLLPFITFLFLFITGIVPHSFAQNNLRKNISLDQGWRTITHDHNKSAFDGFEKTGYDDKKWKQVDVPHTWDDYHGYRRMRHGNRHGFAWYRKTFRVQPQPAGKRYFLFFEGVGSYATV